MAERQRDARGRHQGRFVLDQYNRPGLHALVQALDQELLRQSGVLIDARIVSPVREVQRSRYTHAKGLARFLRGCRFPGDWEVCVVGSTKEGDTWDGVVTCNRWTCP